MKVAILALSVQLGCVLTAAFSYDHVSGEDSEGLGGFDILLGGDAIRGVVDEGFYSKSKRLWHDSSHHFGEMDMDVKEEVDAHLGLFDRAHRLVEEPVQASDVRVTKRQAQAPAPFQPDEEHFFAFIVKEHYANTNDCKTYLKKYCDELGQADKDLKKVHQEIKKICQEKDQKCNNFIPRVTGKNGELKNKLKALKLGQKLVQESDCQRYEPECMFLEGTMEGSKEVGPLCRLLRDACYRDRREQVAEEVLLRALTRHLKDNKTCEAEMKKVCPVLVHESTELMALCLDLKMTCETLLVRAYEKCSALKAEVDQKLQANTNQPNFKDSCYALLEQCHFYEGNCNNKPECEKLAEECQKQRVVYTPPGPAFSPIEEEPTLQEKIGLDKLYGEAADRGVMIERPPTPDRISIIRYLIEYVDSSKKNISKDKCMDALENHCSTLKGLNQDFDRLCENNKTWDKECNVFAGKEIGRCTDFKRQLFHRGLSTTATNLGSQGIRWHQLPDDLTYYECVEIETQCFHLEEACARNLGQACMNARIACYQRGLAYPRNRYFRQSFSGNFITPGYSKETDCHKKLLDKCHHLGHGMYSGTIAALGLKMDTVMRNELTAFCTDPKLACQKLGISVKEESLSLRQRLQDIRDAPTSSECERHLPICGGLHKDSTMNHAACGTMTTHCSLLREREELKMTLLKEEFFKDKDKCLSQLVSRCRLFHRNHWHRYTLSCALAESSCKAMTLRVEGHCSAFEKNVQQYDVINKTSSLNQTEKDVFCKEWAPYCKLLSPNCASNLTVECTAIKSNCQDFVEKDQADQLMMYDLADTLHNATQCHDKLSRYCAVARNATQTNITRFCDNSTGKSDAVNTTCARLEARAKEQSLDIFQEISDALDQLERLTGALEELRKKAKDAMSSSGLLLVSSGKEKQAHVKRRALFMASQGTTQNTTPQTPSAGQGPAQAGNGTSQANNGTQTGQGSAQGPQAAPSAPQKAAQSAQNASHGRIPRLVTFLEAEAFDLQAQVVEVYVEVKEVCQKTQSKCRFKEVLNSTLGGLVPVLPGGGSNNPFEQTCNQVKQKCEKIQPLEIASQATTTTTSTTTSISTVTVGANGTVCKAGTTKTSTVTRTVGTVTTTKTTGSACPGGPTADTWVTSTSTHTTTTTATKTRTCTVTLTTTRRCRPTQCEVPPGGPSKKPGERPSEGSTDGSGDGPGDGSTEVPSRGARTVLRRGGMVVVMMMMLVGLM